MRLRLGISPCPNDTFTFHGLLAGAVDPRGIDFRIELLDIQELNVALREERLDVGKASFHVALHLADRYGVLDVGSAIGFGVGPLLLASRSAGELRPDSVVWCPGADTTATLLLRLLHPELRAPPRQVHFAAIQPALASGEAAFGVVIHEGRFTYAERGLRCLADLGAQWETRTGRPLPLGGLLGRLDLPEELRERVTAVLSDSLAHARAHPEAALETMRTHAQEFDDAVLWKHVELYVNEQTRSLGETGRGALSALYREAVRFGVLPDGAPALRCFPPLPDSRETSEP